MTVDFYYLPLSGPCRSVLLTANLLGVKLNLKLTDIFEGEQMTPEFLKLNPQHCLPTLNDNGFVLWESHAIICYLADQYGQNDSIYPKDPKKRALIHQRLYFDAGTLYQRFMDYYFPIMHAGTPPDPVKFEKLNEAYQIFDKILEGQTGVVGDHLSIADLALVTTASSVEIFGFDLSKYSNVTKWLARAKRTIPNYEELNHAGCLDYKTLYDNRPTRAAKRLPLTSSK